MGAYRVWVQPTPPRSTGGLEGPGVHALSRLSGSCNLTCDAQKSHGYHRSQALRTRRHRTELGWRHREAVPSSRDLGCNREAGAGLWGLGGQERASQVGTARATHRFKPLPYDDAHMNVENYEVTIWGDTTGHTESPKGPTRHAGADGNQRDQCTR